MYKDFDRTTCWFARIASLLIPSEERYEELDMTAAPDSISGFVRFSDATFSVEGSEVIANLRGALLLLTDMNAVVISWDSTTERLSGEAFSCAASRVRLDLLTVSLLQAEVHSRSQI